MGAPQLDHAFDGGVTPAMRLLRSKVQIELQSLMDAAERNGADYIEVALQAVATLAEEQAVLLSCIVEPEYRRAVTEKLNERLLEAVEISHEKRALEQGIGGRA